MQARYLLSIGLDPLNSLAEIESSYDAGSVVEVNPNLARLYSANLGPSFEIKNKAFVPSTGVQDVVVSINRPARFSSLGEPTGISLLYPGFRTMESIEMSAIAAEELIAQIGPEYLVDVQVFTNGNEIAVVEAIVRSAEASGVQIHTIKIGVGVKPLFSNSDDIVKLEELLSGFAYLVETTAENHGEMAVLFRRSPSLERQNWSDKFEELKKTNDEISINLDRKEKAFAELTDSRKRLEDSSKNLQSELEAKRELADSIRKENEQLSTKLQESLTRKDAAEQKAKEKLKSKELELEKKIAELNDEKNNVTILRTEKVELEGQTSALKERVKELEALLKSSEAEVEVHKQNVTKASQAVSNLDVITKAKEKLAVSHDEIMRAKEKLAVSHDEIMKAKEKLAGQYETLRKEKEKQAGVLSSKEDDIRLLNKMIAKCTLDKNDLTRKISEKSERERVHLDLLRELQSKLEMASRYYSQLKETHPEVLEISLGLSDDQD